MMKETEQTNQRAMFSVEMLDDDLWKKESCEKWVLWRVKIEKFLKSCLEC